MNSALSPRVTFVDGHTMPQLGLGVYKVSGGEAADIVYYALTHGYRLVDTAAMYDNEEGVGEGIRRSGLARSDVFVTTKFWMDDLGYDKTIAACRLSLEKLGLEYLDLYMVHWPAPARNLYTESWRAMETLRDEGLVRSLGVSNFHPEHLENVLAMATHVPVINQIEIHPWLTQDDAISFHQSRGILTQAWSPLARGQVLALPELEEIARVHSRSVSQVVLRWHLQRGYCVIPKSSRPDRITENADVFDFDLTAAEIATISGLHRNFRTGVDPNDRN